MLYTDMGWFPLLGGLTRFMPSRSTYSSWAAFDYPYLGPFRKPQAQEWTPVNGAAVSQRYDRIVIDLPIPGSVPGFVGAMWQPLPAAPYTLDIAFMFGADATTGAGSFEGIGLSDGTKYKEFSVGTGNGLAANNARICQVQNWTTASAVSTAPFVEASNMTTGMHYLRLCSDGVNWTYRLSGTGRDYTQVFSEAVNSFLTATQWGVGGAQNPAIHATKQLVIYHAQASPGILGDLS